jgi:hypothetical protein
VRRTEQAGIFQIGQDVADGRGADVQARVPGQGARSDRFAILDIAGDQRAQQLPRACIQIRTSTIHGR